MKQLILARIEQISKSHNGFSKSTMRWSNYFISNIHISQFNFSELSDYDLIMEFERLIRQHSKQM